MICYLSSYFLPIRGGRRGLSGNGNGPFLKRLAEIGPNGTEKLDQKLAVSGNGGPSSSPSSVTFCDLLKAFFISNIDTWSCFIEYILKGLYYPK